MHIDELYPSLLEKISEYLNNDEKNIIARTCKHLNNYIKHTKIKLSLEYFSKTLPLLKYALKNNCPKDKKLYMYAISNNSLECIKYLHKSGIRWDKTIYDYARVYATHECLKYLYKHGLFIYQYANIFSIDIDNLDDYYHVDNILIPLYAENTLGVPFK